MNTLPLYYSTKYQEYYKDHGTYLSTSSGLEKIEVVEGIPRFAPRTNYADAFGAQWKKFRLSQLDSYSGFPISRERLRKSLGRALWDNLKNKTVLEAGCGAGRFTEILLEQGAYVMSIDLSYAVEANKDNFPVNERHRVAQSNILNLPFHSRQFDIVLCLGVVQHTPNPEATIAKLYEHVRPGGSLVFDHYTYSLRRNLRTKFLFRTVFKRLSAEKGMYWSEKLVDMFFPLHKAVRNNYPLLVLLSRISPINSYYHTYPYFSHDLLKEWAYLDTHDTLTDWYKHLRTRNQIRHILKSLGLKDVKCEYGGNGVEARGARPLIK